MKIAPSILSADFANLERDIQVVEKGGADLLHVDVMDGHFVPNLTFGPSMVEAIRPVTSLPLDVHLMVSDPEMWIPAFAKAGADTMLVHVEATPHIHRAMQLIRSHQVKAGVVINPGTPVSLIEPILPIVDQVLVMTVNPGFGGQKFLPEMADKVADLAEMRAATGLDFKIEVDGGVSDQTIEVVAKAGADIAVAGSYVYQAADPAAQIATLKELA
ncbi:ribulose-phosphate 3-epimerase [Lacticaseibacillus saniviri]|uniref:Ribulose-phosphate 3-epimerase n=1 Tax=Lacticaseibacillus saniviri JCM 17471 = DSM 24301 TaxID=1293598 RepID=A0A0R2MY89_9LACO|nr:ribulose-phosphate 3-epimerase [Lacticaseibacillus saniviri]KRO18591.1 ribulose-phosphate 3-epimerase [Lacticaseibacillus saniviri JCM 17471 = DSM 24301]MCG4281991.1 ribulose-phosphate 3-epimerase [Lacticaseibacillus saniviri]